MVQIGVKTKFLLGWSKTYHPSLNKPKWRHNI